MAGPDSVSFAIDIESNAPKSAKEIEEALQKLKTQIQGDTAALRQMQGALRSMQGGAAVDIQAFKSLRQQIEAQKASIAQANAAFVNLGGKFDGAAAKAGGTEGAFNALGGVAARMPGPLNGIIVKFSSLKGLLGSGALALGLIAVAAAVIAVTAAAIAGVAALIRYGLATADARRNELLHLEGLTKLRNYYGIAAGSATQLQGSIDRVSRGVAIGRDKVAGYAEQLYRMGLRGRNLSDALEGVSITASVQGDAAASAFAQWTAGANATGQSVKKLSDDVKARLGGIAARQMLSLDVLATKLHESFAMLFSGLKIEKLLEGFKAFTDMFSQDEAIGRALKTIIDALFQPLIDGASKGAPLVKRFFQGMVIGALLVTIGVLRLRNWFVRTFGDVSIFKGIDYGKVALYAGLAVVILLTAAVGALGLALFALALPWLLLGGVIMGGIKLVQTAVDWIKKLGWKGAGLAIVQGIVDGIKGGAKWLWDALTNLGSSAWKSFKNAIGAHSPSKLFMTSGLNIAQGVAEGIRAGSGEANEAAHALVTAPGTGGPQSVNAQRSMHVEIHELHVHAGDERTARSAAMAFRDELARVLEGVAIQLGAPEVPA